MHHLDFEVPGIENFAFTPGQFVSVIDREDGKDVARPYSIASPRNGNRFSLCVNRVEDEIVSPWLFDLEPGDEVDIHEPLGHFALRDSGHRVVFVAIGTGIAPFRSMLLDHLPTARQITLLFGVRNEEGLLYRDELYKMDNQYKHFRFLPTITRPSETWTGRTGRVQEHLDEALAIRAPEDLGTVDVYVCGFKQMVDDVRKRLRQRGLECEQIIYEKYD